MQIRILYFQQANFVSQLAIATKASGGLQDWKAKKTSKIATDLCSRNNVLLSS